MAQLVGSPSLVMAAWVAGTAFFAWRMRRTISGWLFATAGAWLVFFLFGKQAAMNYFYLIGFTLLLAVATYGGPDAARRAGRTADRQGGCQKG